MLLGTVPTAAGVLVCVGYWFAGRHIPDPHLVIAVGKSEQQDFSCFGIFIGADFDVLCVIRLQIEI